jgi:hypothetical protein
LRLEFFYTNAPTKLCSVLEGLDENGATTAGNEAALALAATCLEAGRLPSVGYDGSLSSVGGNSGGGVGARDSALVGVRRESTAA